MPTLILTHESALAFWRSPASGLAQAPLQQREIHDALEDVSGSIHVGLLAQLEQSGRLGNVPFPLDLLTSDRNDRRETRLARFHCVQSALPDDSLRYWKGFKVEGAQGTRVDLIVSSPEFCFVQMARRLDDIGLLELGCELCGDYRLDASEPRGYSEAEALSTPEKLAWYASEAGRMPGARKVRRLAKHVPTGARCPEQARLALMASMPRSLGGIGAPMPELDHVIEVPDGIARVLGSKTRRPDLFWPQINTAVELDTRSWSNAEGRADYEERKAEAYRRMGVDVVSITRVQLESLDAMRRLFEIISRRCGKRRKPVNERQAARQEAAHGALFGTP